MVWADLMALRSGGDIGSTRQKSLLGALAPAVMAGAFCCTAPRGPLRIADPDPDVKIRAIKQAVASGDRAKIPPLIKQLESDDPAVRFYAIEALGRLTGQTLGYVYFHGIDQRREAVGRWKRWAGEAPATTTAATQLAESAAGR